MYSTRIANLVLWGSDNKTYPFDERFRSKMVPKIRINVRITSASGIQIRSRFFFYNLGLPKEGIFFWRPSKSYISVIMHIKITNFLCDPISLSMNRISLFILITHIQDRYTVRQNIPSTE